MIYVILMGLILMALYIFMLMIFYGLAKYVPGLQPPLKLSPNPLIFILSFIMGMLGTQWGSIEYSRYEIHQYIHSQASPWESPNIYLYLPHRVSCGNALNEELEQLYGDIPGQEYNSIDPSVRARALRMSVEIAGFREQGYIPPEISEKAQRDPDPLVQKVLQQLKQE